MVAPAPDRLLSLSDVCGLSGFSEDGVRRLVRERVIPPPLQLGPRTRRWRRSEVEFLARLPRVAGKASPPRASREEPT